MTPDRLRRRAGFDRAAELYDRARPGYPPRLFDDLVALAGTGRVLELGAGTGKATVSLARKGYSVLALELGPRMAAVAAANLASFDNVRIEVADFDRWTTDEPGFDLVFSANALHWLDPDTRYQRAAALLRPGGALATVTTHHIAGGSDRFYADVQRCYRRYDPATPPHFRPPAAADVPFLRDLGPWYERPVFRRYEWTIEYDTAAFLDLERTQSGRLAMPPPAREGLMREIGALIDGRYGGRITTRYLVELRVARLSDSR
jgi:SAM-dependent methyltransferase